MRSSTQPMPTNRRISIGLLGATAFIVTADVRVINPLLPVLAHEFKADIGSTGFIVTAYAIPYGLFQLVYGPLGDRLGKLKVMTVAMVLFALGTAACAFAPNLVMLDGLRFLTGVAAAAMIPLSLAYIGDTFPYQERQTAIGHYLGAIALGQIMSTSLGGVVADYLSWRYIFLFYGLLSLVIGAILWQAIRNIPDLTKSEGSFHLLSLKPYVQLLVKPAPRLVIIAVFIEGFFFFGGFSYLGAFLRDQYHLLYVAIGLILSTFGLGSLLYSSSVRWLVRTFGENGLILLGGGLIFVCYVIIALLNSWIVFLLVNILLALGYYMLHSTLQTKATEMAPEARGTAVSLFAFSLFVGQGMGAAALGAVVDSAGYALAFVISGAAMALLGAWFVWRVHRYAHLKKHPVDQDAEASRNTSSNPDLNHRHSQSP